MFRFLSSRGSIRFRTDGLRRRREDRVATPRGRGVDVVRHPVAFCDLDEKPLLIESSDGALFDQEHYHGYGAVLVRLDAADDALLEDVLTESWRCRAPKRLLREFDARET